MHHRFFALTLFVTYPQHARPCLCRLFSGYMFAPYRMIAKGVGLTSYVTSRVWLSPMQIFPKQVVERKSVDSLGLCFVVWTGDSFLVCNCGSPLGGRLESKLRIVQGVLSCKWSFNWSVFRLLLRGGRVLRICVSEILLTPFRSSKGFLAYQLKTSRGRTLVEAIHHDVRCANRFGKVHICALMVNVS